MSVVHRFINWLFSRKVDVPTKRSYTKVTDEIRGEVMFLHMGNDTRQDRLFQKDIAMLVGISQASVSKIIREYNEGK